MKPGGGGCLRLKQSPREVEKKRRSNLYQRIRSSVYNVCSPRRTITSCVRASAIEFLGNAFTSVDDAVADSSPGVCGSRGGLALWRAERGCAKMIPWEVNR